MADALTRQSVSVTTEVEPSVICPECDGAGHFMWGDAFAVYADPCYRCDGTGRVTA